MAAVAALRHFHRPGVLVEEDGRVTVLSYATSSPVPTFMRKVPVCVTYALVCPQEGKCLILMDPTHVEERVSIMLSMFFAFSHHFSFENVLWLVVLHD